MSDYPKDFVKALPLGILRTFPHSRAWVGGPTGVTIIDESIARDHIAAMAALTPQQRTKIINDALAQIGALNDKPNR